MPYDLAAKTAAKAYSDSIRAVTFCRECGAQPVEFHRKEHETATNTRVAHLVALGFPIDRIKAEIAESAALCRRCHMKSDGRAETLTANRPLKRGMRLSPKPCSNCGELAKPLRRGLCNRCNHRKRLGKL